MSPSKANLSRVHPLTCVLYSLPFSKAAETPDDDLFPPIRPPSEPLVLQSNDDAMAEDDANAEAATEDGSEEADESDEVCSVFLLKETSLHGTTQDIEFIMEPANRSLDLRCVLIVHRSTVIHLSAVRPDLRRVARAPPPHHQKV